MVNMIDLSKPEVYNKIMAAIEKLTPEELQKRLRAKGYNVIVTERKDHDDYAFRNSSKDDQTSP